MLRANSIMFAARPGTGRSVKQLSRSRDSCRSGSINIYVRSHWRHVVKFGAVQRVTVMPLPYDRHTDRKCPDIQRLLRGISKGAVSAMAVLLVYPLFPPRILVASQSSHSS